MFYYSLFDVTSRCETPKKPKVAKMRVNSHKLIAHSLLFGQE